MPENLSKGKFYSTLIEVLPEHIDALNHVNNVVYLQWINDISEKHWAKLATPEVKRDYFWVAIRHEIDYLRPAFLGEQLEVKTWVGKTAGVRSVRHVEIYRNDTLLTKAQTTWCLMDATTGKITRINDAILNLLY